MLFFKGKRDVRHERRTVETTAQEPTTIQLSALLDIALETWRIGARCRKLQGAEGRGDPAIGFAVEKIHHILKEMGIEIQDPLGETYHEGMGLDVLTFDFPPDELPANRIVQETVSPAVYYNGKLIKMAKVIIGSAGGRNTDAQDHD